jgi:hypothetical protein
LVQQFWRHRPAPKAGAKIIRHRRLLLRWAVDRH